MDVGLDAMKSIATLRRAFTPAQATCGGARSPLALKLSRQLMHVNARAMLQLFPQRRLWLAFRINSRSLQVWRQVSTSSAINRGLKATRDDREPRGGGRDRSKRSFAEPRGASNTPSSRYDFRERTASGPRRRTLGLERSRQDRPNTR